MTKLSIAALVAAGIFAIYSAPSFAAVVTHVPKNPPCTSNCGGGEPTSPGDPFTPGNPGGGDPEGDDPEGGDNPDDPGNPDDPNDPGKDPGDDPGKPGKDPGQPGNSASAELRKCLALLGKLPEVSAQDVRRVAAPSDVTVTPICQVASVTDVQPLLIEGGNADGLERALRSNRLISAKLSETRYKARDVVGIDFDAEGNAILLVHRPS